MGDRANELIRQRELDGVAASDECKPWRLHDRQHFVCWTQPQFSDARACDGRYQPFFSPQLEFDSAHRAIVVNRTNASWQHVASADVYETLRLLVYKLCHDIYSCIYIIHDCGG